MSSRLLLSLTVPLAAVVAMCLYLKYRQQQDNAKKSTAASAQRQQSAQQPDSPAPTVSRTIREDDVEEAVVMETVSHQLLTSSPVGPISASAVDVDGDPMNTSTAGLSTYNDSSLEHQILVADERVKKAAGHPRQETATVGSNDGLLQTIETQCEADTTKSDDTVEHSIQSLSSESVEHLIQCSTSDTVDHSAQSSSSDTVEHPIQSSSSDTVEHSIQSSSSDTVDHSAQSSSSDTVEHPIQSSSSDTVEHSIQSSSSDTVDHSAQSSSSDTVEHPIQSSSGDTVEHSIQSSSSDTVDHSAQSSSSDTVEHPIQSSSGDTVEHSSQSSYGDTVERTVQSSNSDYVEHSIRSPISDTVERTAQSSPGDAVEHPVQSSSGDAVEHPVQSSSSDAVEHPVQSYPDDAVQHPVQSSSGDAVQHPVQSSGDAVEHPVQSSSGDIVEHSIQHPNQSSTTKASGSDVVAVGREASRNGTRPVQRHTSDGQCESHQDNSSEGSSDSGKGGSAASVDRAVSSPPGTPESLALVIRDGSAATEPQDEVTFYEFLMPQSLCGRLIGRGGSFVNQLRDQTGVEVLVTANPFRSAFKNCTIQGRPDQIRASLAMIRERFPERKFPNVTLEQVSALSSDQPVAIPDSQQLHLPQGVTCDVLVSAVVSPGQLFVQQHTHPTFGSLEPLGALMLDVYGGGGSATTAPPQLPRPVPFSSILAAPLTGGWYRAQCVHYTDDSDEVDVRFLDYGGYSRLPAVACRQIRGDLLSLPFQSQECYLANIIPDTDVGWSVNSFSVLEEVIRDRAMEAMVVGFAPDGLPRINLYVIQNTEFGNAAISLVNQLLVDRGVARWQDAGL